MGVKLLSIRQMADKANLTTGYFNCNRSNGSFKLDWVKLDRAVFATEKSFDAWMKQRAERKAVKAAPEGI